VLFASREGSKVISFKYEVKVLNSLLIKIDVVYVVSFVCELCG